MPLLTDSEVVENTLIAAGGNDDKNVHDGIKEHLDKLGLFPAFPSAAAAAAAINSSLMRSHHQHHNSNNHQLPSSPMFARSTFYMLIMPFIIFSSDVLFVEL